MRAYSFTGRLEPGVNLDRIDLAAGMRELVACGYPESEVERHTVIEYALQRWARGEEEAAQRGAIDQSFHGIDLTSWLRVLAAARAAGETLPNGLWRTSEGVMYECRSCGQSTKWPAEITDFDIDNENNMCGRSPRCCP